MTENCSRFLVSRDASDTDLAGWISGQPKKKAGYHRYPAGYLVRPDTGYPARILDLIFKYQV
jgi:hypothetical protein